jgi:transcriptional regulator with XRE-family HTH domain
MTKRAFAKTLRVLRAERGYSLTEASKKIGIDRHTLRQLELGQREPYYGTLRKIAAGYGVEVNDIVGTSAKEAQDPLVEAMTNMRMSVVAGREFVEEQSARIEELRARAEAFVERWGEMASVIKSIQSKDRGIDALLRTVEWAVQAEAYILFREFLTIPEIALRSSRARDRVHLCKIITEVANVADGVRMAMMAMDDTDREARSVSLLQQNEEEEYGWFRAQAVDHAVVVRHSMSGTGLGQAGVEGIDRISE